MSYVRILCLVLDKEEVLVKLHRSMLAIVELVCRSILKLESLDIEIQLGGNVSPMQISIGSVEPWWLLVDESSLISDVLIVDFTPWMASAVIDLLAAVAISARVATWRCSRTALICRSSVAV